MKLVKQPFFLIGIGSFFCAIVIAVAASLVNPSSSVISKYEKALNKDDAKLLAECISPTVESGVVDFSALALEMDSMLTLLGIQGEVEYEILTGEAEDVETEDDSEVQNVPTIVVIKADDKVVYVSADDQRIIKIEGKEYLYTGIE